MKRQAAPALPVVAIIGRPNVGKSTIFNRLVGRRQAIVHDQPGVTRDRHYGTAEWAGRTFALVDTGGFDVFSEDNMSDHIRRQAGRAIEEATAVLFVVDIAEGLTARDEELFRILRSHYTGRLLLLANKADNRERDEGVVDFYRLGVDHVYPVSAEHGIGLDEVLDETVAALPQPVSAAAADPPLRVAIVGRPNVGKSSLVNAILGDERVVVDNIPGTTRDAVDTSFVRDGRVWDLIDTAGIRRRGRIDRTLERYSVIRAVKSMERADICILVLDAGEMMTDQDAHIGGAVADAAKGCVIVVNKWDLVNLGPKAGDTYREKVSDGLKHLSWAPVVFTSALTGRGIEKLLAAVEKSYEQYSRRIATPDLNDLLRRALRAFKPPTLKGRSLYVGYITQEKTRPPTFAVLVNEPSRVHFSYRRYLVNRLREKFGFEGSAVVLKFKGKGKGKKREKGEVD